MELAYQIADLAVARSGASTLTELAWFGIPSLLVPYPFAADDHQTRNAEIFQTANAARLMPESSINATNLVDAVREILTQPDIAVRMKKAALDQAVRDSAERIATLLEEEARKKQSL
jgi:UDP-N-acetylglucosamine--N-acetylmuramyl-(pentapeptide) pyrophosphoryl-undecaprenol N-acetylglucosamine transferase